MMRAHNEEPYSMARDDSESRPNVETVIATPVSDLALTEDELLNSFNQDSITTSPTTNHIQLGSSSPRGLMTLTLGDDVAAGVTAAEQYDVFRLSRRYRHLVLADLFVGFIFIPLFELPAWVFIYLLVPIIGFCGARWYSKIALRIHLVLNWGTTATLCALPFINFQAEIATGGALAFWSLFVLIKTALCFLSVYFVFLLRHVSSEDCYALCDLHSRGVINLR